MFYEICFLDHLSRRQGQPLQNLVDVLGIQRKQGTEIFDLNPWPEETTHNILQFFSLHAKAEKPLTEIPLNDLALRLLLIFLGLRLFLRLAFGLRFLCAYECTYIINEIR